MFVRFSGAVMFFDSMAQAPYALYDIIPNCEFNEERLVAIEGAQIRARCVYFKNLDLTALYVKTSIDLKTALAPTIIRAARWQYGPDLFPYGLVTTNEILMNAFWITANSRRQKPSHTALHCIKCIIEGSAYVPSTKVSAQHLRYVTNRELKCIPWEKIERLASFTFNVLHMMHRRGTLHESFVSGLIMWAMALPDDIRKWIEVSAIWMWDYTDPEDFATRVKKHFTLRLKALQNLVPMDLSPAFETEVLVNRGVGRVDWVQERLNRTQINVANFDADDVLTECVKLFKRAESQGSRPKRLKWEKYWRERFQWAPTGAFHSQYEEDLAYLDADRLSRNKLDTLTKMPRREFQYFASRVPQVRAWSSVKYEWTKMRAIYGVDATNFIMTGYAMGDCERVLSKIFPIGESATEENVRRTVKEVLRSGVPFCFDYEDFNSQHSTKSMQAVLRAYLLVYGQGMDSDQVLALVWAIQSLDDVKIKSDDGTWYTSEGTLLSGWRLTTFINTVLNYVYIQLLETDIKTTTHNGDDVLAAVTKYSDVQKLMTKAREHNVRFQPQKCFLGGIAEFLRIDHKTEGSGQYLARAVSTYVHGPTETALPNNVLALLKATHERYLEIEQRRGVMSNLEELHKGTITYICKKWNVEYTLYETYKRTNALLGGLSTEVKEDSFDVEISLVQLYNKDTNNKADSINYPGAYDYALGLANSLFSGGHFGKIYHSVLKTLDMNKSNIRFATEVKQHLKCNLDLLNAVQRGTYKTNANRNRVMLAKACGVPIVSVYDEVYKIKELLASERDLDKALMIYA